MPRRGARETAAVQPRRHRAQLARKHSCITGNQPALGRQQPHLQLLQLALAADGQHLALAHQLPRRRRQLLEGLAPLGLLHARQQRRA